MHQHLFALERRHESGLTLPQMVDPNGGVHHHHAVSPVSDSERRRGTGSSWRDPSEVSTWAAELPKNSPIVVYCVHGHEVSQGVATQLNELGYESVYLEGGIEGWREAAGEIEPRG